jgi:hypothetical protein
VSSLGARLLMLVTTGSPQFKQVIAFPMSSFRQWNIDARRTFLAWWALSVRPVYDLGARCRYQLPDNLLLVATCVGFSEQVQSNLDLGENAT